VVKFKKGDHLCIFHDWSFKVWGYLFLYDFRFNNKQEMTNPENRKDLVTSCC